MKNFRRQIISQRSNATKSKTSPTTQNRACLCPDNTYHKDCCNGDLRAQGIGKV